MKDLSRSNNYPNLLILGLTGGIGSGKSTVAKMLMDMGALRLDGDSLAHQAMESSEIQQKLRETFGEKIFNSSGHLDRPALGEIVFSREDGSELKKLTSLIHPEVREKIHHQLQIWSQGTFQVVILDIPLLLESPLRELCQVILFVDTPYEKRLERVCKNRGWEEEELKKRESFQMDLQKKKDLSNYCVKNRGDLEGLKEQIQQIWKQILAQNSRQHSIG